MQQTRTRAPQDLSENSRKWWRTCIDSFEFAPPDLRLLEECCRAYDRILEARKVLARDGTYIEGRLGLKPHPALLVERDSVVLFSRLVRDLHLPQAPDVPNDALADALKAKNGANAHG
jgi:phage terminase small subunit